MATIKTVQPEPYIRTYEEIAGDDRHQLLVARRNRMLWTYAANSFLALWLISGPSLYVHPKTSLTISDLACGLLLLIFESVAFVPRLSPVRWMSGLVGVWLLVAPLVFWAVSPATFLLDTLIGCLVIAFAIIVPGAPGKAWVGDQGPDQPPGWTYNPSSWIRRWLGIGLALLGFFISRYLATRQLGYMHHAWDPFFGSGSDHVLHSTVSRMFPVSDAGLGSVAYLLEVLFGFMGDKARWRTAPYAVLSFALLVVPLGLTSVLLVITQPMVVGAWCGLCLVAAGALLISLPLAVHEIIAMGLFLLQAKKAKKNLWFVFWNGAEIFNAGHADPERSHYSIRQWWIASVQGVTVPLTLALQLVVGVILMAKPGIFPAAQASANLDHLAGALIVTIAAVATAEVTRTVRWLNAAAGLVLIVLSVLIAHQPPLLMAADIALGVIVIATSTPLGRMFEKYDGWDRYIK